MKEYTYSVARVRAKETSLMTKQDIEQLISADSYDAALRFARDRGYRADYDSDITAGAQRDLWEFIEEIADKEIIRILRLPTDYHNIKASVKAVFSGIDGEDLLLDGGTADKNEIYKCVKAREYKELDKRLAEVCEEAVMILNQTQDGQLCDIYIDKAMLAAIGDAADKSGDAFMKKYADMLADTSNLKAAYRCALSGKALPFIENAVYDGGTLNTSALKKAAAGGLDALFEFAAATEYAMCAESMKVSAASFEKRCADEITHFMERARYESFSSAPIIAYFYVKKAEIEAVRLILYAKRSRLGDELIRERVRDTYV